jgi:hypothetical protein
MAQEHSNQRASEPLLAGWIKWTMDFWEAMAQMGPAPGVGAGEGEAPEAGGRRDPYLSSLQLWQAFFSLLTEPGTVAAVFQGIKAPSETILRMAQAGWGGYFYLHQQWLAAWQGAGVPAEDYGYESLDQDIFKICNDIYENDFRQLLNLPHLHLTGLPQGHIKRATEKFNQFQAAMAEFIYLLFLPVKKSLRAIRAEGITFGEDNLPIDFKEYYKRWLKILEGHYMTLFQSEQYGRTLSHTLMALEEFTTAKQELVAEAMTVLGLPSPRDLDGLYREIYLLKKRTRMMAKQLDRREPSREEG